MPALHLLTLFRFLHAADTHIDSPLEGLDIYDGAPVDALRGATRAAFENLVRLALDEKVDFLLLAGDVYDGDWKDFSTGLFFTRQMARLKAAGIPVYLIAGNHDAASVLTRRLSLPDNVQVFSTRVAETRLLDGLPVAIHGRGFPHRAVPENLALDYPARQPGRFNIGLLHTSLTGAPGHDAYAPCSLADLAGKGYQYWALGHVHQPQVVARAPWVVYPGNSQGRHIREAGARGCRLVTVGDDLEVVDAEFRALDVVRWARLEVDISGINPLAEVYTRIGAELAGAAAAAEGRLLAVRVVLTGVSDLHAALKRDLPGLRAECINQAQRVPDGLWIETVEVRTAPRQNLADLAARDDLTRIVLETLEQAAIGELAVPVEIGDLLKILPAELRDDVEADLAPSRRADLLDDVRGILLSALERGEG
ncbi:MAG: DNA repair exonuclease [Pseudomonadota bacterium]|nr:DNA repair exonuclease [Pseudomonadota bacterium]MDP1904634.1 DNA repair exonuclease [Pseudomonadota bacterium]MDP2352964.1 DNA repair exonuclease [Pseudomonadota bacterium]